MNEVFLIGKIISDIEFKFIINKHIEDLKEQEDKYKMQKQEENEEELE